MILVIRTSGADAPISIRISFIEMEIVESLEVVFWELPKLYKTSEVIWSYNLIDKKMLEGTHDRVLTIFLFLKGSLPLGVIGLLKSLVSIHEST